MPKFRKKPVEVEAWQVTDETFDGEHPNPLHPATPHITYYPQFRVAHIETHEGVMRAEVGDWIIKEPFPTDDRQFYPCKPDIFEATYEPLEGGES